MVTIHMDMRGSGDGMGTVWGRAGHLMNLCLWFIRGRCGSGVDMGEDRYVVAFYCPGTCSPLKCTTYMWCVMGDVLSELIEPLSVDCSCVV